MNYRIKKWWYTPPNKDDSFFVHIRETFQIFFKCKHHWYNNIDLCHGEVHGLNTAKRYCSICGKKQYLTYPISGNLRYKWKDEMDFDKLLDLP